MVPDPYKALGLPHEASQSEIKSSYRKLAMKYHPDRLTRQKASPEEMKQTADRFSAAAAAYQLLSDPQRKKAYDHIYKYGGYDEPQEQSQPRRRQTQTRSSTSSQTRAPSNSYAPFPRTKESGKGIGYVVKDPLSMFCSTEQGQAAVAGIQIPARMHLSSSGGLRFAFSSGQFTTQPNGSKKFVSKTTQLVQGKKYSRVETTTLHPDGRKEVVIEGNDYVERHVSSPHKRRKSGSSSNRKSSKEDVAPKDEKPWYIGAWHQMRETLSMCHNPCGTILAQ